MAACKDMCMMQIKEHVYGKRKKKRRKETRFNWEMSDQEKYANTTKETRCVSFIIVSRIIPKVINVPWPIHILRLRRDNVPARTNRRIPHQPSR